MDPVKCCVCGGDLAGKPKITHDADGDGRRYCRISCIQKRHVLSLDQLKYLAKSIYSDTPEFAEHQLEVQTGPVMTKCSLCGRKYESAGESELQNAKSWFRGWCLDCTAHAEKVLAQPAGEKHLSTKDIAKLRAERNGLEVNEIRDVLGEYPNGFTAHQLSERFGVTVPHVSTLLQNLKREGLIQAGGSNTWFSRPDSKQCAKCGQQFYSDKDNRLYCSRKCKEAAYARRRADRSLVPMVREEKECPTCHKTFQAHSLTIYCSQRCQKRMYRISGRDRSRPVKETEKPMATAVSQCVQCGKNFVGYRSDRIYCSKACARKAFRERQRTRDKVIQWQEKIVTGFKDPVAADNRAAQRLRRAR